MDATHYFMIEAALSRWLMSRTIYRRVMADESQGRDVELAIMSLISALDNLRSRMVSVLNQEQQALARSELADTMKLSYINDMADCITLIRNFSEACPT